MADNKKYYYLKLKENFFESDEMIVLESMTDGYLYSNILLKLYLRSLKNEGRLMFNERIPFSSTMLANVTRHQVGTIEKAMSLFRELGLVEVLDNGAIYMMDIQNFIGESSTEADRIRAYRKRLEAEKEEQKAICTNVQQKYDKSTPELEIEKELEKEKDIEIDKHHVAKAPRYDADNQYYKAALYLRSKILTVNERQKVPKEDPKSMDKWSDAIRKIIELDKRTMDELKEITEFVFKSDFWDTVIQSPAGLRKHWDKIWGQLLRDKKGSKNSNDYDSFSKMADEWAGGEYDGQEEVY